MHQQLFEPTLPQKLGESVTNPVSVPLGERKTSTALLGWILRAGAITSASTLAIGTLLLFFQPKGFSEDAFISFPHTLTQVWLGLLALQPQAVIALGLILLIATPVTTITMSVVVFARERDYRFIIISLVILSILISSFLIGKGGG